MKRILQIFIVLLSANITSAQTISKNFKNISREKNDYYNRVGKDKPGYKQFKRWEWYYSTRTGEGGVMVDNARLNLEALQNSSANRSNATLRTNANTGSWSALGPAAVNSADKGIGRVNRIAFHPTNANTLYAACATGGLWITTDGGASWYSYSEGIPNMALSGVAVDYTNPSIIYILTGDADASPNRVIPTHDYPNGSTGVLKSYDGGFTWYRTGLRWEADDFVQAYKMIMHPSNPNILIIATDHGIFRTTNGGNSWDSTQTTSPFYDIEFQPGNPSVVYASGTTSDSIIVMKSTNTAQTFTKTHGIHREENFDGNVVSNRSALGVSGANNNYVYLLAGPCTAAGNFQGFYRSTDAGETFTLRTSTPNILGGSSLGADARDQHGYDLAVAVSPTNINRVACGGIRLWTSTSGGSSFSWQDDNASSISFYHPDIHDMAYHPLDNGRLYMCGDGGVYVSGDNGDNWITVSGNLAITQYYRIAANPTAIFGSENVVMGGTQDNGTNKRSSSGGSTFSQVLGSDGMDCLIDPDGTAHYIATTQNGVVHHSSDAGANFFKVGDPESVGNYLGDPVTGRWVTPVAEIAGSTTQYVIGYNPVVLATNISSTWVFTRLGWSGLTFTKTARGNANRIFIGDNDRSGNNVIRTSTDKGSNWTLLLNESNSTPVTDLAFDPTNGSRMWITYGGYTATRKVRFSNDGGVTWNYINGGLPNVPINCILYDGSAGAAPDAIYIGTDIGVFYRDNNLGDWIPFSNGLPVVEVTDMEMHPITNMLRAGTYGRGIWETSRYSGCPAGLTLTPSDVAMFKPYYFQVSTNINSSALHFGTGANVYYKAGYEIKLTPGFAAGADGGNVFEAALGPCGGGIPARIIQPRPLKGFLVN